MIFNRETPITTYGSEFKQEPFSSNMNTFSPVPMSESTVPFYMAPPPGSASPIPSPNEQMPINVSAFTNPNHQQPPMIYQASASSTMPRESYKPLTFHWYYRKDVDSRVVWRPFSTADSAVLEQAFIESM